MSKSFTIPTGTPIEFTIGDQKFEAVDPSRLPAGVLLDFLQLSEDGKSLEAINSFLDSVLTPESSERLNKSTAAGSNTPIPLSVLLEVAGYLADVFINGEAPEEEVKPAPRKRSVKNAAAA